MKIPHCAGLQWSLVQINDSLSKIAEMKWTDTSRRDMESLYRRRMTSDWKAFAQQGELKAIAQ